MSSIKPFVLDVEGGCEYQPLLDGPPQTHGMRSGRVFLKPGEDCGEHTTGTHEEMLVFLAGSGVAMLDDEGRMEVAAGQISYIPPHTRHNVKNNGGEPLVYIYCVAPVSTL
jgi:mannose-6-phosphate isomerase-like protein (cupin superfamily)